MKKQANIELEIDDRHAELTHLEIMGKDCSDHIIIGQRLKNNLPLKIITYNDPETICEANVGIAPGDIVEQLLVVRCKR